MTDNHPAIQRILNIRRQLDTEFNLIDFFTDHDMTYA